MVSVQGKGCYVKCGFDELRMIQKYRAQVHILFIFEVKDSLDRF